MLIRVWRRVTKVTRNLCVRTPVLPLALGKRLIRRDTLSLCYHMVGDQPAPHTDSLYGRKPGAVFEDHLLFLKENFEPISYSDLRTKPSEGSPTRPRVLLTFDDGLRECFDVARPLLKKHSFPCIFFIPTGYIGNAKLHYCHKASLCMERIHALDEAGLERAVGNFSSQFARAFGGPRPRKALLRFVTNLGDDDEDVVDRCCSLLGVDTGGFLASARPYMEEAELRLLASEGFTIGAHSVTHRHLGTLPPAEQRNEILNSVRGIQSITGATDIPFAFPFSADGVDRSFLVGLRSELSSLGLFFDLHGMRHDSEVMVNRIWAESPLLSPSVDTPMGTLLRNAYQAHCFGL